MRLYPAGASWGLFGLHTVPADSPCVVITEGEYDAMAVYQATGYPAVSLPNGASSLPVDVLPLLERFKEIYLWMDDDVAGREGAAKFARKLGTFRCLIVPSYIDGEGGRETMRVKDANDALRMGVDMTAMLKSARRLPHAKIATFADYKDVILHELMNPDDVAGGGEGREIQIRVRQRRENKEKERGCWERRRRRERGEVGRISVV